MADNYRLISVISYHATISGHDLSTITNHLITELIVHLTIELISRSSLDHQVCDLYVRFSVG